MALITGSPIGNLDLQEDIYLEGAPTIFIQDVSANPLNNPDSNDFYWGLSGTTSYPAYELGCLTDVNLSENLTMNEVLCDNVGVKDTVQQRNYFELSLTLQSFFPLATLRHVLGLSAVTTDAGAHTETLGMGKINNNQYWMVYAPKVYDEDVGDYVMWHFHRCKFVDAWTINMPFGDQWEATGLKLRAHVDSDMPAAQQFGVMLRSDASVL